MPKSQLDLSDAAMSFLDFSVKKSQRTCMAYSMREPRRKTQALDLCRRAKTAIATGQRIVEDLCDAAEDHAWLLLRRRLRQTDGALLHQMVEFHDAFGD